MSTKTKTLRLLIGDPGRTNDPFGAVGLEATWPKRKIFIRLAKQFKRKPYRYVANEFKKLQDKIHFDLMILEKNFEYDRVSQAFSNLPITYVTTTGNMTEFKIELIWDWPVSLLRQVTMTDKVQQFIFTQIINT
jgi:hypothetical protein